MSDAILSTHIQRYCVYSLCILHSTSVTMINGVFYSIEPECIVSIAINFPISPNFQVQIYRGEANFEAQNFLADMARNASDISKILLAPPPLQKSWIRS